ncbi:MAG TPA: DUF1501 domain-containing protein [Tepidisphaeraceae bacterium]|jgi:hypothetical protein
MNRPSPLPPATCSRRQLLWNAGGGLGGIAAAYLLGRDQLLADVNNVRPAPRADLNGGIHHRAKAHRVIQLFMNGGASPMDTFDYKPQLARLHGQKFDPGGNQLVEAVTSPVGTVLKSPFKFDQYGDSGRWVSSVFPQTANCVDDLTFLMSMVSKSNVHGLASYMQNTGFIMPGFPAMGAWISYALGRLNDNLPAFVVLPDARGLPYNNQGNFSAAFLPAAHSGMIVRASDPTPIHDLLPPKSATEVTRASESDGLDLLRTLNHRHLAEHPGDSRLEARIESYELAARLQTSAPELLDLSGESESMKRFYGLDDPVTAEFGRRCLIARRMIERGVRFVQVWSGPSGATRNWDNHANIQTELPYMANQVDRPTAALVHDLKSRGLLDDTLLVWTTEFGRQPFSQSQNGRDHNGGTFVTWLAGAGLRPGVAYGQSDQWAWRAQTPIYCYDLHATILHLLGIDHTRLTFRHNGIDRRLTDVHGQVIREILA